MVRKRAKIKKRKSKKKGTRTNEMRSLAGLDSMSSHDGIIADGFKPIFPRL